MFEQFSQDLKLFLRHFLFEFKIIHQTFMSKTAYQVTDKVSRVRALKTGKTLHIRILRVDAIFLKTEKKRTLRI